jgi:hypothetical protein
MGRASPPIREPEQTQDPASSASRLSPVTDDVGQLSARERETVERAQAHTTPGWSIAGRDQYGQLVLTATVNAGSRHPGKTRVCLLTVGPDGLRYQERLIDAPDSRPGDAPTGHVSPRLTSGG